MIGKEVIFLFGNKYLTPNKIYIVQNIEGELYKGIITVIGDHGKLVKTCSKYFTFKNAHICVLAHKYFTVGMEYILTLNTLDVVNVIDNRGHNISMDYEYFKEEWEIRQDKLKELIK